MKKIYLTQNKYTLVDDEDFNYLNQHKWHLTSNGARRNIHIYKNGFKKRTGLFMHRQIMNPPKDKVIDHINHNRLDNRKNNLRICTNQENTRNYLKPITNTSGFKGVSYHKLTKKWEARIRNGKEKLYLGLFNSKIKAAKAYDKTAKKIFGAYALLNFN